MDHLRFKKRKHQQKPNQLDGITPKAEADKTGLHVSGGGSANDGSAGAAQTLGEFNRQEGFFARKPSDSAIELDGRALGRNPRHSLSSDTKAKQHSKKRRFFGHKDRDWRKISKRSFLALTVLVLVIGGWLAAIAYFRAIQVFRGGGNSILLDGEVDPSVLRGEGDGRINILLLGKDDAADLTDTILIASIDPFAKDAGLLSLPRDLCIRTPCTANTKINAVFALAKREALAQGKTQDEAAQAGIAEIEKTVSEVIGIPIHYHSSIDFRGFMKAVDILGGVEIDVPSELSVFERMYDDVNNRPYFLQVPPGPQHFDSTKALFFTRTRMTSQRADLDRNARQRLFLLALKDRALSLGTFSNPVKISELINTFGDHVRTNFSIDELVKLYNLGEGIEEDNVKSIGLADPPNDFVTTQNIGGVSFVVPKAGLLNYGDIHHYVRNTLIDGFIRRENPAVIVLNGTSTTGLAQNRADILKSYGYNVINVGDVPNQNFQNNVLVDMRKGEKPYTKRYLELRYRTAAIGKLPNGITVPETADFVIILGQNEAAN